VQTLHQLDLVQFLAQDVELQDPFENKCVREEWTFCEWDANTFAWLLQKSNSTYQQESVEVCVGFLTEICRKSYQPHIARLVKIILKGKKIDATLCGTSDKESNTLLHCAAWNLGAVLERQYLQDKILVEDESLSLISDLIKGGSELHALTSRGRTPMLEVIRGELHSYWRHNDTFPTVIPELDMELGKWLKQLKDSGVDLVTYGEEEQRVLGSPAVNAEYVCYEWLQRREIYVARKLRLVGFTYGPEPDDWKFWFVPVMDKSFIHFWEMVDHPERAMPGAWEEEPSDDDEYWSEWDESDD